MHTYQSWLYKNYQKPLNESDTNGLIVAFDPTRKNALLHQQVTALQERTQFDRRVIAKADSYTTLLTMAEQAWHDGYEHLMVLTASSRISEVSRMLQERCGMAFTSIEVVPESAPRLFEADPLPNVAGLENLNPAAQQPQQQTQQKDTAPFSLFFIQLNPPVKETRATLEAGMQELARLKAPNPYFVLHNAGIDNKYAIDFEFRDEILRGDGRSNIPTLYGKQGLNPVRTYSTIMKHPALQLGNQSVDDFIRSADILADRQCAAIVVPQQSRNFFQFNEYDAVVRNITPDSDSFAQAGHKRLIDMGRKIAKECPRSDTLEEGKTLEKAEIEESDLLALFFLNMCFLSETLQGEAFRKEMTLSWGKMSAGAKEFWNEAGQASGIGELVGGIKDIATSVATIQQKEADPGAKLRSHFHQLEAMKFDPILAVNHSNYADFKSALDLGKK